jgi:hypothetical protein
MFAVPDSSVGATPSWTVEAGAVKENQTCVQPEASADPAAPTVAV